MKKKNSTARMVGMLLLDNVYVVVWSFLVLSFAGVVLQTAFKVIVYAFLLFLFFAFVYNQAWGFGNADYNAKAEKKIFKSVLIGVYTSIPNVILCALFMLSKYGIFTVSISFLGQPISDVLYHVWNIAFRALFDYLDGYPFLCFVPVIFMILTVAVGYIMGYKKIKMSDYIYYTRDKEE